MRFNKSPLLLEKMNSLPSLPSLAGLANASGLNLLRGNQKQPNTAGSFVSIPASGGRRHRKTRAYKKKKSKSRKHRGTKRH